MKKITVVIMILVVSFGFTRGQSVSTKGGVSHKKTKEMAFSGDDVSNIDDLDSISLFHFAIMSDNKGDSPYKGNYGSDLEKSRLSMERLAKWTSTSSFVLGLGDHLVNSDASDPFLDFIQNDPHWRVNFYPNIADGENQAFGSGQDDWGSGKELFNYVDDFWGRDNVVGQGNDVDYYAFFEINGPSYVIDWSTIIRSSHSK